jgi:lipopolysaccharide heptosyltransferase II
MLTWLRRSFPDAKIGWAIDEELASAIEGHPALDYIHPIARKRWSKSFKNVGAWPGIRKEFIEYIDQIKAVNYDVAIDTQSLFKSSFTAYCAGIKRRVGYGHNREMSGLFLNERYMTRQEYFDPNVPHIEHHAKLAQMIGCTDTAYDIEAPIVPPEIEGKIAAMIRSGFSAPEHPIVAIAPGTQWESKLWPNENWVSLISTILSRTNLNILMVGSKGDMPLNARILQAFPSASLNGRVLDISGKTNIREMYSVYRNVAAAIGADSAPQHIAGAVKTPCVIALFGATSNLRTPPFGSPVTVSLTAEEQLPCQPCHKKSCALGTTECMTRVTPERVFGELIKGLEQSCSQRYLRGLIANGGT